MTLPALSAGRPLYRPWGVFCLLAAGLCVAPPVAAAADAPPPDSQEEDAEEAPSTKIEIPDEPRTIDPATVLPAKLAVGVTVTFQETSLSEVAQRIQEEQQIAVFLDGRALDEAGILSSEPISDSLADEPLYLLFNRLQTVGLSWYVQDDNVHITTVEGAEEHIATTHYNVGDLFDAGFEPERLTETIVSTVSPDSWNQLGGPGSYVLLGDVLFVRQTDAIQREVAGLLAALRDHGRRTFVLDAPQNELLRQRLEETISVNLRGVPLIDAVDRLSDLADTPIRLDRSSLRGAGVRERTPVTLEIADQKLRTALIAILHDLELTWVIRDGLVWVISQDDADEFSKTAVYDVRDLARNFEESKSLQQAIESQASPDQWEAMGGFGSMDFPKPGVLVVHQTERNHDAVLQLLENYRLALRTSKARRQEKPDPKEVLTHYYRMPTAIASDLRKRLPELLRPETWRSEGQADAPGTILQLASRAELQEARGYDIKGTPAENESSEPAIVVGHSVLVIRQMREVHDEIPEIIQRIEYGDEHRRAVGAEGEPAGVGGMGGFGGGFF